MKQKRGTLPAPTLRQKRAIDGLIDAIRGKSDKPLYQVLEDAGYAPESARQWTNVMAGIRPHLQPTLDWMELHRVRIQREMEKKIDFADYNELSNALYKVSHLIQLLSGKATQNIAIAVNRRQELDALIEDE